MNSLLRIVFWDVDGVLTTEKSSWDFLLSAFHKKEQCKQHKDEFFSGKINYETWAQKDIGLLKGTSYDEIMSVLNKIETTPGISPLLESLEKKGVEHLIVSAGIDLIAQRFNIPYKTNNFLFNDHLLSGVKVGCGLYEKGAIVKAVMEEKGLSPEDCAAVGDTRYDSSMFEQVTHSIAFNGCEEINKKARYVALTINNLVDVFATLTGKQTHVKEI